MIRNKRIIFFIGSDLRLTGGSNIYSSMLINTLSKKNKIIILSYDLNKNLCKSNLSKEKASIIYLKYFPNPLFQLIYPIYLLIVALRIKKINPDLILINNCSDLGIFSRILKIPSCIIVHGEFIYSYKKTGQIKHLLKELFFSLFFRNSLFSASKIIVVRSEIKNFLIINFPSLNKNNIVIIPNGIDFSVYQKRNIREKSSLNKEIENKSFTLLSISRLSQERSHTLFIKIMPLLLKEFPNIKLVIIGDGPLRMQLKKLVKELNIKENVFFMGDIQHDKIPKYILNADIVLQAFDPLRDYAEKSTNSLLETMNESKLLSSDLAILESLAAGKLVIALKPNIQITNRIINLNDIGILLPLNNKQLLIQTLKEIINNRTILNKIGYNAQQFIIKNRSMSKMMFSTNKVLKSIMK